MTGQAKRSCSAQDGMVLATSEPSRSAHGRPSRAIFRRTTCLAAPSPAQSPNNRQRRLPHADRRRCARARLSSRPSALPFEEWRLLTAIPRSTFAGEIDRNTQRVLFVVGGLALLAAATAVLFANLLFARPLAPACRPAACRSNAFELDAVSHTPTFWSNSTTSPWR